jgi:uncharacterized membrane protein
VGTGRLETFADGVFAIAATLLILNVDTQVTDQHPLASELAHAWPSLSPTLAAVLYAAIAAFYVVESSLFGRGGLTSPRTSRTP